MTVKMFVEWPGQPELREGMELLVIGLEEWFKGRVTMRQGVEIVTEDEQVEGALAALFGEAQLSAVRGQLSAVSDQLSASEEPQEAWGAEKWVAEETGFVESVTAAPAGEGAAHESTCAAPEEATALELAGEGAAHESTCAAPEEATALELAEGHPELGVCAVCAGAYEGKGFGKDGQYCSVKCQRKASTQRYAAKQKRLAQEAHEGLEDELRQVLQYRVESNGKEISDPAALLQAKRLAVGERLHRKDGRVYEVVQRGESLKLRKVSPAGATHQDQVHRTNEEG